MDKIDLKLQYGITGLILIIISECANAANIKSPELPVTDRVYVLTGVLLFALLILIYYFWHHRIKGHKSVRIKESDIYKFDDNFDEIPKASREKYLRDSLNDKNRSIRTYAAVALIENFTKITRDFREEQVLLYSKSETDAVRIMLAKTLPEIFDDIPINLRNELIRNLACDKDITVREYIVRTIRFNIQILPEDIQNLLLKFADDENANVRTTVAEAVYSNFNSMPAKMRKIIIKKLARDKSQIVRKSIMSAVKKHEKKLPENFVNEIMPDDYFDEPDGLEILDG